MQVTAGSDHEAGQAFGQQAVGLPKALWITGEKRAELRPVELAGRPDWVEVQTFFSGISRGTESLVFAGGVPQDEYERMRCPFQEGEFPYPVKYGYATVGIVRAGPPWLMGRTVFALHPHQSQFRIPADAAVVLPPGLSPGRAVLGANMETALNVTWDARVAPGDRIAVIGAGVVGALTGWVCARIPGTEVTLIDTNSARRALAQALGCRFATPEEAPSCCDVVIHASGSVSGLQGALECAGTEARIVEASWYGKRSASIALGGRFHSLRLQIVSSQVGRVPPDRRVRWPHGRRLAKALELLASDSGLDALVSGETRFDDLPRCYGAILADPDTLCRRIRYHDDARED